jgi:hypothetical protein
MTEDSPMIRYTVACRFVTGDQELAQRWVQWLLTRHLQDVLDAGAQSAELIALDDELPHYEIDYRFPNRAALQRYLSESAPKLRAEGLRLFPLELGLEYRRTMGNSLHRLPAAK